MPRAKAKAAPKETETAKAYRHTRTGAVRFSTSILGYPYEAVETKVEKAPKAKEEATDD